MVSVYPLPGDDDNNNLKMVESYFDWDSLYTPRAATFSNTLNWLDSLPTNVLEGETLRGSDLLDFHQTSDKFGLTVDPKDLFITPPPPISAIHPVSPISSMSFTDRFGPFLVPAETPSPPPRTPSPSLSYATSFSTASSPSSALATLDIGDWPSPLTIPSPLELEWEYNQTLLDSRDPESLHSAMTSFSAQETPKSESESEASISPVEKRKRGRPRKESADVSTPPIFVMSPEGALVKRGRGRPRKYPQLPLPIRQPLSRESSPAPSTCSSLGKRRRVLCEDTSDQDPEDSGSEYEEEDDSVPSRKRSRATSGPKLEPQQKKKKRKARRNNATRPFRCDVCSERFTRSADVDRHLIYKHSVLPQAGEDGEQTSCSESSAMPVLPSVEDRTCVYCAKVYSRPDSARRHEGTCNAGRP